MYHSESPGLLSLGGASQFELPCGRVPFLCRSGLLHMAADLGSSSAICSSRHSWHIGSDSGVASAPILFPAGIWHQADARCSAVEPCDVIANGKCYGMSPWISPKSVKSNSVYNTEHRKAQYCKRVRSDGDEDDDKCVSDDYLDVLLCESSVRVVHVLHHQRNVVIRVWITWSVTGKASSVEIFLF